MTTQFKDTDKDPYTQLLNKIIQQREENPIPIGAILGATSEFVIIGSEQNEQLVKQVDIALLAPGAKFWERAAKTAAASSIAKSQKVTHQMNDPIASFVGEFVPVRITGEVQALMELTSLLVHAGGNIDCRPWKEVKEGRESVVEKQQKLRDAIEKYLNKSPCASCAKNALDLSIARQQQPGSKYYGIDSIFEQLDSLQQAMIELSTPQISRERRTRQVIFYWQLHNWFESHGFFKSGILCIEATYEILSALNLDTADILTQTPPRRPKHA